MAKSAASGQVIVETAIIALLMVGLFLIAVSISQTGAEQQAKHRFFSPKGSK